MTIYSPDIWSIVRLNLGNEILYKVLGGWYGGYLGSNHWRLNSGITKIEQEDDFYLFYGYSGSVYRCHKSSYGMNNIMAGVIESWKKQFPNEVEILQENTRWIDLLDNSQITKQDQ